MTMDGSPAYELLASLVGCPKFIITIIGIGIGCLFLRGARGWLMAVEEHMQSCCHDTLWYARQRTSTST